MGEVRGIASDLSLEFRIHPKTRMLCWFLQSKIEKENEKWKKKTEI